ncbi:hypothetical protein ACNKHW_08280 [Shigella flexneri]
MKILIIVLRADVNSPLLRDCPQDIMPLTAAGSLPALPTSRACRVRNWPLT